MILSGLIIANDDFGFDVNVADTCDASDNIEVKEKVDI